MSRIAFVLEEFPEKNKNAILACKHAREWKSVKNGSLRKQSQASTLCILSEPELERKVDRFWR